MPNIIDDTQAAAAALDGPGLARALVALVDRIADWDEAADSWPCDCGAEARVTTLADLDRLNAHDPSCPYRMYFELRALAGALHLRSWPPDCAIRGSCRAGRSWRCAT